MNRMIGYAAVCAAVLASGSAGATTYDYVGQPLTTCIGVQFTCPIHGFAFSVTFDFDTLGFSGTIDKASGHITSLWGAPGSSFSLATFTLDNAAIVDWQIRQFFTDGPQSFTSGDHESTLGIGGDPNGFAAAFSAGPGVWTPVDLAAPVPGPVVGAGLPGLAFAFGGLMTWMRRRVRQSGR